MNGVRSDLAEQLLQLLTPLLPAGITGQAIEPGIELRSAGHQLVAMQQIDHTSTAFDLANGLHLMQTEIAETIALPWPAKRGQFPIPFAEDTPEGFIVGFDAPDGSRTVLGQITLFAE